LFFHDFLFINVFSFLSTPSTVQTKIQREHGWHGLNGFFSEAEKIFQKITAKANQIDFSGLVLPVLRLKSVLIYPILVIRVPFFIVSGYM